MRVATLASGSEGNATIVEAAGVRLLVDAGLGPRATLEAMREAGIEGAPDALVVTHAHLDHFGHARRIARHLRIPAYVTESTVRVHELIVSRRPAPSAFTMFGSREGFCVGGLTVESLPLPHDIPQVGLVISDGHHRIAIATDLGEPTAALVDRLAECDVVLLESNYDPTLLAQGPYPRRLKRRIASAGGHLSNGQTRAILARLGARVHTVVLLHLSRTNNTPELALESARDALRGRRVDLHLAPPRGAVMVSAAPRPRASGTVPVGRRRVACDAQLSLWPALA